MLMIGERTNSNGSKAFRDAMLGGKWDDCIEIARAQTRDGAHLLDLCVDYVGRDGAADMAEVAARMATASTLPIMLDSTEPPVIGPAWSGSGGRSIINSVNYEDGDGPESRFAKVMPMVDGARRRRGRADHRRDRARPARASTRWPSPSG